MEFKKSKVAGLCRLQNILYERSYRNYSVCRICGKRLRNYQLAFWKRRVRFYLFNLLRMPVAMCTCQ